MNKIDNKMNDLIGLISNEICAPYLLSHLLSLENDSQQRWLCGYFDRRLNHVFSSICFGYFIAPNY